MSDNFWINRNGANTLKGSHTNSLNPVVLPDIVILEFLKLYPKSRDDFYALFDSMLLEEQYRLQELIDAHPSVFRTEPYQQDAEDQFQTKMNNVRVNTTTRGQLSGVTRSSDSRSGLKVNIGPLK